MATTRASATAAFVDRSMTLPLIVMGTKQPVSPLVVYSHERPVSQPSFVRALHATRLPSPPSELPPQDSREHASAMVRARVKQGLVNIKNSFVMDRCPEL
jgi:hypothetical protein